MENKAERTASFHGQTMHEVAEMPGTMGLTSTKEFRPWHRMCRMHFIQIEHYGEIYPALKKGDILKKNVPESWDRAVRAASSSSFDHVEEMSRESVRELMATEMN